MNGGYLKMLVIEHLRREDLSGYSLVKQIRDETGWKPSYGSVYPLLKELETCGCVTVREDGRRKVYTLTKLGKEHIADRKERMRQAYERVLEQLRVLEDLGDDVVPSIANILKQIIEKDIGILDMPELRAMRKEIYRLIKEGKLMTHKDQVAPIFSRAARELKAL